jgi:hypothetical protein
MKKSKTTIIFDDPIAIAPKPTPALEKLYRLYVSSQKNK